MLVLDSGDTISVQISITDLHPGAGDEALIGQRTVEISHVKCANPEGYDMRDIFAVRHSTKSLEEGVRGVIHIGAHVGQEASGYSSLVGDRVVHIECNPAMIPALQSNVTCLGHAVVQACLWNRAGERRQFHLASNQESSSLVGSLSQVATEAWKGVTGTGSTQVVTETWATLVSAHRKLTDSTFNALVVDTQGAELEILQSVAAATGNSGGSPGERASRGLAQFKYLLVEVSNREYYKGQTLQPSLEAFLDAHGFENVRREYPVHGDVLYVHRNVSQCAQP